VAAQQIYICPLGPGPGEVQVDLTPSGRGIGAAPLWEAVRKVNLDGAELNARLACQKDKGFEITLQVCSIRVS
jgi:hypothetical protein